MSITILPKDQVRKVKKIMDDLLKHTTGKTVADFKAQYNLTKEEYDMIYEFTMPLIRETNVKRYWVAKYEWLKKHLEELTEGKELAHTAKWILDLTPEDLKDMSINKTNKLQKMIFAHQKAVENYQNAIGILLEKSSNEDMMVEAAGYLIEKVEWQDYSLHSPTEDGEYLTAIDLSGGKGDPIWLYSVLPFAKRLEAVDDYDFMGVDHGGFYTFNGLEGQHIEMDVQKWFPYPKLEDDL